VEKHVKQIRNKKARVNINVLAGVLVGRRWY
jgi:hypothetical protein